MDIIETFEEVRRKLTEGVKINPNMIKIFQRINAFFNPERRAATFLTLLVLSFLLLLWWQARNYIEAQLVNNAKVEVQDNLDSFGSNLHQGILDKISLTESLSAFVFIQVADDGELNEIELGEFAARLYQSTGRIKNIAIAPGGVMQFVYPYEENKSVLGYEPIVDDRPEVREQVNLALETGEVTISQPVTLIQGGLGLITRQAVFVDGQYWGLTNIVLDVPGLLDDAGITESRNIDLAIKDYNGVVFVGSESVFSREPVFATISLPGGAWQIAGVPHQGWAQFYRAGIQIIDAMAYLIMLLVSWMVYAGVLQQQVLAALVEERTSALRATEKELLKDISKREKVEREKDRLLASESHQRAIAESLTEIALALNSHVDIDSILQEILEQIQVLIPYETANIVLFEGEQLNIQVHRGYDAHGSKAFYEGFYTEDGNLPIDYHPALSGKHMLIGDVTQHPDWIRIEESNWIRSFLSVPIIHQGKTLGMIRLDGSQVNQFSERDIQLLTPIANAAAIALENASLLIQAQNEIIERVKAEKRILILNDQLEERVQQRTQELENANRELEAFSYSISHDLRAPLRAVSGISEVFREEYAEILDPQAFEYLERMDSISRKMSDLIEGLLTLTQLGRHQFLSSTFVLQDLAREVYSELQAQVNDREIKFSVIGRDEIQADQRLISALLTNLFSNAIKFTLKEKLAEIEVGSERKDGQLVFFVKDNGIGLDVENPLSLFEPFQRLYPEEEFEGMGIGLAIVKRIVLRHQGRIWVESTYGKGACFYFTLNPEDE